MTRHADFITEQAYALFASDLSCRTEMTDAGTRAAIQQAIRTCGGTQECATAAAHEYGDHPDTASQRMRWALTTVTALYGSTPYAAGASPEAKKPRLHDVAQGSYRQFSESTRISVSF
jgi:hypothetical protein